MKKTTSIIMALLFAVSFVFAGQISNNLDNTATITHYGVVTDAQQRQMCNNIKLWNPNNPEEWCSSSDTYTTYCVVSGYNEDGVYRYEKNVCSHTTARSRYATTFVATHLVDKKDSVQLYSEVYIQRNNAIGESYPMYWIRDSTRVV